MEKQQPKKPFSMVIYKNRQMQLMGWIGRWVNSGDNMKKQPMNAENVTHLLQALGFAVCATEEHKPENSEKNDGSVHVKITSSNKDKSICLKREMNVDLTPDEPIRVTFTNVDVEDEGEPINLEGSPKKMSFELSKIMTSIVNYLMHMMYNTQNDSSQIVSPKQIHEPEPTTEENLEAEEKPAKLERSKSTKKVKSSEKRCNIPSNVLDYLKNASSAITNAISVIETVQSTSTKSSKVSEKPEGTPPIKTSWLSPSFRFFRSSSISSPKEAKQTEPKKRNTASRTASLESYYQIRPIWMPDRSASSERIETEETESSEAEKKKAEKEVVERKKPEKKSK